MFILRTSPASPFGRKVIMVAAVVGLANDIIIEHADPMDPNDSLHQQNVLGKIPTLVLPGGQCLYDSRVIAEYLDDLAGGGNVIPAGEARWEVLRQQAVADGLMDAALLIAYEGRFRTKEQVSEKWVSHQQGKIRRALEFMATHYCIPVRESTAHLGEIAMAAALGYLDLRFNGDWRADFPGLVGWLDKYRQTVPSYDETAMKG
ncbi:glutathione S-transferase family protein [Biostraticola tofi]|uniref:Glutathione S-transferase n=1 Tax=Biostraticola tofi TaxID=466109 RepID=A0A4R3Z709_9GAMM|nr:glutathione S-transferase family protein [Biostraticola tofi]TCW00285.1 glutathione S-transferase [Biostraticola tofi]